MFTFQVLTWTQIWYERMCKEETATLVSNKIGLRNPDHINNIPQSNVISLDYLQALWNEGLCRSTQAATSWLVYARLLS